MAFAGSCPTCFRYISTVRRKNPKAKTSLTERAVALPIRKGQGSRYGSSTLRSPSVGTVTTENAINQPADNTTVAFASTVAVGVAGTVARAAVIDRSVVNRSIAMAAPV